MVMAMEKSEPALLTAKDVACLCQLSLSVFYKHLSTGKIPLPIRIGGVTRWRAQDITQWIEAGCPPRQINR